MEIEFLIVVLIGTALYWYSRTTSRFFNKKYDLDGIILLLLAVIYSVLSIALLTSPFGFISFGTAFLALFHFVAVGFKYHSMDYRYRWLHYHNRAIVNYDIDHTKFTVTTDDKVSISGIHIPSQPDSKKVIIVCHGASRTKYTAPIVQTCMILSTEYNVLTFDFRGHMDSGGTFFINGDEIDYDLAAVIDYAKMIGYEHIAVFGWSIGGISTIRSVAKGLPIDAFIAGAPAVEIPEAGEMRLFRQPIIRWLVSPVLLVSRQVRMTVHPRQRVEINDFDPFAIDDFPHIPMLLFYNDYDYVIKIDSDKFEYYFSKLPPTKTLVKLDGRGHLFDWPNNYLLWNTMMTWLQKNF